MRGRGVEGDNSSPRPQETDGCTDKFWGAPRPQREEGEPVGDNLVLSTACVGEKVETTKMPILEGKTKYA